MNSNSENIIIMNSQKAKNASFMEQIKMRSKNAIVFENNGQSKTTMSLEDFRAFAKKFNETEVYVSPPSKVVVYLADTTTGAKAISALTCTEEVIKVGLPALVSQPAYERIEHKYNNVRAATPGEIKLLLTETIQKESKLLDLNYNIIMLSGTGDLVTARPMEGYKTFKGLINLMRKSFAQTRSKIEAPDPTRALRASVDNYPNRMNDQSLPMASSEVLASFGALLVRNAGKGGRSAQDVIRATAKMMKHTMNLVGTWEEYPNELSGVDVSKQRFVVMALCYPGFNKHMPASLVFITARNESYLPDSIRTEAGRLRAIKLAEMAGMGDYATVQSSKLKLKPKFQQKYQQ
jgi:hypothetical protein